MTGTNRRAAAGLLCLLLATGATAEEALSQAALLSRLAGAEIRLFDLQATDAVARFSEFLRATPMQNQRPVPETLAADTTAALKFYRSTTRPNAPSYFVASYVDKSAILPLTGGDMQSVRNRYGEDLYPQAVCPVFASHADTDAPELLSAAAGLPRAYFEKIPGERDNYHLLFLLTEASHCGFIAHTVHDWKFRSEIRDKNEFRSVLEATGDFEATRAFRALRNPAGRPDEADVLLAARIVAMFLRERTSAYSSIPAFTLVYQRSGIVSGNGRITEIRDAVAEARSRFRQHVDHRVDTPASTASLEDMRFRLEASLAAVPADKSGDDMVRALLELFPVAVRVLLAEPGAAGRLRATARADADERPVWTLPGLIAPANNAS